MASPEIISIVYGNHTVNYPAVRARFLHALTTQTGILISNQNLGGDPTPNIFKACTVDYRLSPTGPWLRQTTLENSIMSFRFDIRKLTYSDRVVKDRPQIYEQLNELLQTELGQPSAEEDASQPPLGATWGVLENGIPQVEVAIKLKVADGFSGDIANYFHKSQNNTNALTASQAPWHAYKSGLYSDLTITCGNSVYKVHKMIVCLQSDVFNRMCNGGFKEASTDIIHLPEDEPDIIKKLIEFFYTSTYHRFSQPSSSSISSSYATPPSPENTASSIENTNSFILHAKMYTVADKYNVPHLLSLSAANFSRPVEGKWKPLRQLLEAIAFIMTSNSHSTNIDTAFPYKLRNIAIDRTVTYFEYFNSRKKTKALLRELFSVDERFALEVLRRCVSDENGEKGKYFDHESEDDRREGDEEEEEEDGMVEISLQQIKKKLEEKCNDHYYEEDDEEDID